MDFRTIVPISKNDHLINYQSKIFSLGSCFAENIASKFDYYKFDNQCNPFGIIFNTVALEKIVARIVDLNYFSELDIFENNGLWQCFEVHSNMSNSDRFEYLQHLNSILLASHEYLKTATDLILTLGTSWAYELNETKQTVANCHKIAQSEFTKILLSAEQNTVALRKIIYDVQKINSSIKVILTISPVRHLKDGFFENNVSKSTLFAAIFNLNPSDNTSYFPSYEIVMDELRDYRFYQSDFLHPSQMAIDYIWSKFKESHISKEAFITIKDVESIQKMISHRHANKNSVDYQIFSDKLHSKITKLNAIFPKISF